ncbi:GNAT family N-acetyltransferase [Humibacillus xanthopallidus]|uniref:Putative acetyltransferase n=1 Tax=Humibacillus xanthopallidus TaxID=412689 RepID=A0A543HIW4_9MICO|nr:GNAT family N-acetyltransferase [Humibacillus xanthopallidus]TQM58293.1 putative acetyltransferase [Humibacillus xanthopallidus]
MIELVRPSVDLAASWWALVEAFDGATIHGSGLRPGDGDRLRDPEVFAEWVDWLAGMERSDEPLPEGRVACSYRWVLDDGRVVGTIAVRHSLTPSLLAEGGHIGYAVGPGDRGRGVASSALALALDLAHRRGIDLALITCDVENVASSRTIERAVRQRGGFLEDVRDGVRRYWVVTDEATVGGA